MIFGVSRGWIRAAAFRSQASEQAVQELPASTLGQGAEPRPQLLGARWPIEQPQQERPKVKPRSAHDDRPLPARAYFSQHAHSLTPVISCREDLLGLNRVKQMMRNAPPLFLRRFPGADAETAVHLHGVAVDDLSVQPLR